MIERKLNATVYLAYWLTSTYVCLDICRQMHDRRWVAISLLSQIKPLVDLHHPFPFPTSHYESAHHWTIKCIIDARCCIKYRIHVFTIVDTNTCDTFNTKVTRLPNMLGASVTRLFRSSHLPSAEKCECSMRRSWLAVTDNHCTTI